MPINKTRVFVGGIAAGIAIILVDTFVNSVVLRDGGAQGPDLSSNLAPGTFIAIAVGLSLLWGIVIAWTYASIRLQYGPGVRTAMLAGFQIWSIVMLILAFMVLAGTFTWSYFVQNAWTNMAAVIPAALIAGGLYRE